MPDKALQAERIRRVLVIAALAGLGLLLYAVLQPFVAALAWAVILALSLWPLRRWLGSKMPARPGLAAGLMAAVVALGILIPLGVLSIVAAQEAASLGGQLQEVLSGENRELASQLEGLPVVGDWVRDRGSFNTFVGQNRDRLLDLMRWLVESLTRNVFKFVVCVFATYFLFRHGESLVEDLRRGVDRLGGERMTDLLQHVRETVRGDVYGLVLTAIVQAVLAAFGFWLAGVPYPLLLGSLMLVVSFIPFGPPLVWLPASLTLLLGGDTLWGILLFIWGAGVISTVDNILRPIFIGQATQLPVFLVFMGVLGGIVAFGLVGLFVGPVVIAVALALWRDWISRREPGLEVA